MSVKTAAPFLALLKEEDQTVKSYALQSINDVVDQLWSEVSNDITDIEALYEDINFQDRYLAALVVSKIYYNLGEYQSAVKYALAAGEYFDVNDKSKYVETIVSQSIDLYIRLSTENFKKVSTPIEPQLVSVFERMLNKCISTGDFKLALGIALESCRLDVISQILTHQASEESTLKLVSYVLVAATTTVSNTRFKVSILHELFEILINLKTQDYFAMSKIIVNLNDSKLTTRLFNKLALEGNTEISYQIAFDLVTSASQGLLNDLVASLGSENQDPKLLKILSGIPTCEFSNIFLYKNKKIDLALLIRSKAMMDGKFSLFHTAVSVSNAFMHAGTTDDSFIRSNLQWLGKAQNWAKFTATASLGIIQQGNLSDGKKIMEPYLPGSRASSRYIKGGSLYGLGLIYAGYGKEIISYLKQQIVDNSSNASEDDIDILLYGASLGIGLAGMGSNNLEIYEALKEVLYTDSANSGAAASLGIGLTMLGSGEKTIIDNLFTYSQETNHGEISRGLSIALALINYGCEEMADEIIEKLLNHENDYLRYGAAFVIALAYAGTSNNKAIKKLLHIAVSDSNDDVRRAAVTGLGFILIRDYTTVPRIVELLSESHNPHVRCGTAFALGISCAGRGLQSAYDVLEPLTKDSVDFVRQAAMIALSMILIQQTEKTNPKVNEVNELFRSVTTNKHQEGLAKFGACVAQGIMNAGGCNVTIQLENPEMGTLNTKSVIGLAMFVQFWYWFPLSHFLSLSFTPTAIIGVRSQDLCIPKFSFNCHTKQGVFGYPPMFEGDLGKTVAMAATAVLSTTAKAKARAKKSKKDKGREGIKPEKEEIRDKKEIQPGEDEIKIKYTSSSYKVENASRVLPQQLKYISFGKEERFIPVRKFKGSNGVILLSDKTPSEPIELIKIEKQVKDADAPLPTSFKVEDDLEF